MNMKLEAERIGKSTDWLVGQSFNGNRGLYAILDAAREASIPRKLYQQGAEFVSLYRGDPQEELASVSPYLIKIDTKPKTMEWILNEGWGNSWGILFLSSAGLDDLRRHFRRFLLVGNPEGKELYFRFYDPRVLRVYLPTCTPFEAKRFFGPVSVYLMESEDGQAFQEFSRGGNRMIKLSDLDHNDVANSDVRDIQDESNSRRTNQRLRIREEQMKAFSAYMHVSFEKRVAAHLRKEQPERTKALTDSDLDKFIEVGVIRAQNRGFTREADLGIFLELMLLLGVNFDEKPDLAAEIFENPEMPSAEKMDRLRQLRDAELDRGLSKDE
jgi:hypothetical protein